MHNSNSNAQISFCHFVVGAKGGEEAAENRNYLAGRMIEEVTETIRVLQVRNLRFIVNFRIKRKNFSLVANPT